MPIRIRDSADPLSEGALQRVREVILARSEASRVLQYELLRYCNSQIGGRSFLIAGHRGAGKTTMVADALNFAIANRTAGSLRPLPILLHGPSLLETLPSDLRRDNLSLERTNGAKSGASSNGSAKNGSSTQPIPAAEQTADGVSQPSTSNGTASVTNDSDSQQAQTPAGTLTVAAEKQAQVALVHVILGLHRAVVREFALKYRDKVLQPGVDLPAGEAGELAGQFEIELHEDPPAFRLREYWQYAGAMSSGILFDKDRPVDQGARELVAINGICNAHQRISGALSHEEHQQRAQIDDRTKTGGFDVKAVDALKPLGAVLAGAGVAGAAAVASTEILIPSLMGLATAFASSVFLKSTVTSTDKRQRDVDRTFIPDLTPRTLDRVLPTLINRLKQAGLAPVLIVDELDKVGRLSSRLEHIIHYLKKLMAEEVFSCFLTDRGYLEWLRMTHKDTAYCRASSYFSHQLLIAYTPQDIDTYLSDLLEVTDESDSAAPVDREVLKWVLRHRSQLHALSLSRELAAIRSYDGQVNIPPEAIRDTQYRIDVTLQMAIELQLYSKEVTGWRHRQSSLQQVLFDALYYLSRSWLRGDREIDLSPPNKDRIVQELIGRMNLKEAGSENNDPYGEQLCDPPKPAKPEPPLAPLNPDDMLMLTTILERLIQFLSPQNKREGVERTWREVVQRVKNQAVQMPPKEVMEALLVEDRSLLKPLPTAADGSIRFEWRYWRSGELRDPLDLKVIDSEEIRRQADDCIEYITQVEMSLLSVLAHALNAEDFKPFSLLSEGCRVLSTSPAWLQVRMSIANLAGLRRGTGNANSIERDCDRIAEFAEMVQQGEQTVVKVLLAAAMLCGISEGGTRPLSVKDAIAMLSTALGFVRLNPAEVRNRVQAFWAELRSAYGQAAFDEGLVEGEPVPLISASMAAVVEQFVDKGRRWSPKWDQLRLAAWKSVEGRLQSQEAGKGSGCANLAEILCAARSEGPSPTPGVDLERIPLDVWTSILVNAMRPPTEPKTQNNLPWLVGFALRNLGAHNLMPTVLQNLLAALERSGVFPFRAPVGKTAGLVAGDVAVIVRRSTGSLTQNWTSSPTLGMVMMIDAQQLIETHLIEMLLKALPTGTLHIAWEEPADSLETQNSVLTQAGDDRIQSLYMYSAAPATAKEPCIVDPTGPDAVLRRVRAGDPPRP